jgi:GNAT superfamily N-acetyltransferase
VDLRPAIAEDLTRAAWAEGRYALDADAPLLLRTTAAREGDEVVGLAGLTESRLHPSHLTLAVEVHPDHRRRGVGTALVRSLRADGRPGLVRVFTDDAAATAFVRVLGGTVLQTLPPEKVRCASPAVRAWAEEHRGVTHSGTEVGRESVRQAWLQAYAWVHAGWVPVRSPATLAEVFDDGFLDGLDLAASRFTVRDGRVSAGAFVLREVYDDAVVVVTEPTTADDTAANHQDTAACLAAVLADQADREPGSILVDCHVSDPHTYPLLQSIPDVTGRSLVFWEVPLAR